MLGELQQPITGAVLRKYGKSKYGTNQSIRVSENYYRHIHNKYGTLVAMKLVPATSLPCCTLCSRGFNNTLT